jgi:UDP-N-acetylmuramoylalanine--D-glutamate ligase
MSNRKFDCKTYFPDKVAIIGAAKSGIAATRYFIEHGVSVVISDLCSSEHLEKIIVRNNLSGCQYEGGGHTDSILDTDLIVISPGVPSDLPILLKARQRTIPVWSEMELGFRASRAPFLAVTGSSGKSTTVSLTGAALAAAGIEHVVAGNIGIPVISAVPAISKNGFIVAEVSSFQLETIDRFQPYAAVVLNLLKNHLDRYPSEKEYFKAKKEIARNLTPDNYLLLNANDPLLASWGKEMADKTRVLYFGANVAGSDSFWCEGTVLRFRHNGKEITVGDCKEMMIHGRHNYENASVAAALAVIAGADNEAIYRGLCEFKGLPHRLEFVATINGVSWFNDSKSTTAESVDCAIKAFSGRVHLIAGGKDKGCDFSVVDASIKNNVKDIVLIGEAAERMKKQWDGMVPITIAPTLKDAVSIVYGKTTADESVVFSPGCSSFDMFKNYEDRGDRFRDIVQDLLIRGKVL